MMFWTHHSRLATTGVCAAGILMGASPAAAQLHDVQASQLTASDGTMFDVANAFVRVPEQRTGAALIERQTDAADPGSRGVTTGI